MRDLHTSIATATPESVTVRGKDLINELVGKLSFTEMLYFSVTDRIPTRGQARLLDACLVMLMEHGFTPSALVARLVADAVPGEIQVAIGSGLMTIGSIFAGSVEGCAAILAVGIEAPDPDAYCREVVSDFTVRRQAVPGFGHRFHAPDDPRTPRLLALAAEEGLASRYVDLLNRLGAAVDAAAGRHLTINATGAIAALLLEIGLSADIGRAVAVVARAGGLVGHIVEERQTHSARAIARLAAENIPYRSPLAGEDG